MPQVLGDAVDATAGAGRMVSLTAERVAFELTMRVGRMECQRTRTRAAVSRALASYASVQGGGPDRRRDPLAQPEMVLGGSTMFPLPGETEPVRVDYGDFGEVAVEGWTLGDTRVLRLSAAADLDLDDAVLTVRLDEGFVFDPDSVGAVVTGGHPGIGSIADRGWVNAVAGVGEPMLSEDGRTLRLGVAEMPAGSALAFLVTVQQTVPERRLVVEQELAGWLA